MKEQKKRFQEYYQELDVSMEEAFTVVVKQGLEQYPKAEIENVMREVLEKATAPNRTREYKDRVFRLLFQDKERLLSLYNALNHKNYQNPDELIINDLDYGICIGMRNALSFVVMSELNLYEEQSSWC